MFRGSELIQAGPRVTVWHAPTDNDDSFNRQLAGVGNIAGNCISQQGPDVILIGDEVFNPAQFEDFDFCYRAREAGWQVLYDPSAEMYHYESVTTDDSPDVNYKYVTIRNGMEFKKRWRHVFTEEDGPPDDECTWAKMETRPMELTGIPPMVDD